nr:MAG TPA: hypothetical protein [Caudoviricetes sp.]DAY08071.1 MAG TPA: hypothetical protein [Caudoviricetes sp.]
MSVSALRAIASRTMSRASSRVVKRVGSPVSSITSTSSSGV